VPLVVDLAIPRPIGEGRDVVIDRVRRSPAKIWAAAPQLA
jgi:hypothetical protein